MARGAPVGAGTAAAPGRAAGYGAAAVVVAGTFAGADPFVESAGCDVDGLIPVALAALVFMGDALCTGMPAMLTGRVSTSIGMRWLLQVGRSHKCE